MDADLVVDTHAHGFQLQPRLQPQASVRAAVPQSVAGQTKQASKWPAAGAVDWSNVPVLSCPVVPDLTTTRQMLQACVRACLSFRRPCAVIPVCSVRIRICIRLPCRCSPTIEQIPGLSAKQFRLQAPARSTTTNVACIAKKLKSYS